MDLGDHCVLPKCVACRYVSSLFSDIFSNLESDRTGERYFHQSMWWWGVCIGFVISLSTQNTAARYVSLFLMACGYVGVYIRAWMSCLTWSSSIYTGASMALVWVSSTFPRPPASVVELHKYKFSLLIKNFHSKRAAVMGIVNSIGNLGNLSVEMHFRFPSI